MGISDLLAALTPSSLAPAETVRAIVIDLERGWRGEGEGVVACVEVDADEGGEMRNGLDASLLSALYLVGSSVPGGGKVIEIGVWLYNVKPNV